MEEVMVMIPEQNMKFFLELMQKLGIDTFHRSSGEILPSHMEEVRRRESDPSGQEFSDWDEVKQGLDLES